MTRDYAVRQARHADHDAVVAITEDTWPEREDGDYVAEVFPTWVDADGADQRTFVACATGDATDEPAEGADGEVVGVVQAVRLSSDEAWYQGMRVHPDHRGEGVSEALNRACFEWSRTWGATVGRLMVYSWNVAGLGAARANGFEPTTEFRWMHPEPNPDADPTDESADPDAAWSFWTESDAHDHLGGLSLDRDESWACSALTRETLRLAGDETAVLSVTRPGHPADGGGTLAMSYRVRDYSRDDERVAEYGVAAWADEGALSDLLAAVARDAAAVGADRTRVLIPETARHVTDATHAGVAVAEEPDFVLAADLTGL